MARPQKPGKFKYQLETVLKVRGIKEKREQETFGERQREYRTEKEKEEKIEAEKRRRAAELKGMMAKGPTHVDQIIRRTAHLSKVKEDLVAQAEKVAEANQKMEDQRVNLVRAMKERKIIDKDKEKKHETYNQMMKKLEMQFIDELASLRFVHEKRAEDESREKGSS